LAPAALVLRYSFRKNSGSFATLAAIRRASSFMSIFAAECRPAQFSFAKSVVFGSLEELKVPSGIQLVHHF
jgi:hypothetical protein